MEKEMATHSSYSCLEKSMDRLHRGKLSPWGLKESDMTERLNTHTILSLNLSSLNHRSP